MAVWPDASFQYKADTTREQDPYFPFAKAPLRWATSMARLGVHFRGGTVNMDLCDRAGKYSNGFCHWPSDTGRGSHALDSPLSPRILPHMTHSSRHSSLPLSYKGRLVSLLMLARLPGLLVCSWKGR